MRIRYGSLPSEVRAVFRTSPEHGPPHFHAMRQDEYDIRIFFELPEDQIFLHKQLFKWPKKGGQVSGSDRKALLEFIRENRARLREDWAKVEEANRPPGGDDEQSDS